MRSAIKNSQGFTLIELIIALLLLTFLSVFTAQSIQQATKDKRKVQADIERSARLRGALSVIERDLNLALNHRDMGVELHNLAVATAPSTASQPANPPSGTNPPLGGSGAVGAGTSTPPNPANQHPQMQPKKEVQITYFIGEAQKLNFTSTSLARLEADAQTSIVGEVGYSLKNCRSRMNPDKNSNCLWRRTSNVIDTDPLLGGTDSPLLEDVKELKFRYLGHIKPEEWEETWTNAPDGPPEMKGLFPYAVEITIEISERIQDKEKSLRMTTVATIHNPNNPEKKDDQTSSQTAPK